MGVTNREKVRANVMSRLPVSPAMGRLNVTVSLAPLECVS